MTSRVLGLAFLLSTFVANSSYAQSSSLNSALGSANVDKLLKEELATFSKKHKLAIDSTAEGWKLLKKLVGNTTGPTDFRSADTFAREGFEEFLKDYAKYWQEQKPGNKKLPLDPESIERYYRDRRDSCGESPCKVPPCCGNGVQCSVCPPKKGQNFEDLWKELLREPPASERPRLHKE